jgi:hypothetical protein
MARINYKTRQPHEYAREAFESNRQRFLAEYNRFSKATGTESGTREQISLLKSHAPSLGKFALARRYDDLFEDFVKLFEAEGETVEDKDDYTEALKTVLKAKHSDRLERALLRSGAAENYFQKLERPIISKTERLRAIQLAKDKEKIGRLLKQQQVIRVSRDRRGTEIPVWRVTYKVKGRGRVSWRNVNTGRFGPKPK